MPPAASFSGEEAVRTVVRWVETHSNWDESVMIVSSDHGHYLVVDDPQALTKDPTQLIGYPVYEHRYTEDRRLLA